MLAPKKRGLDFMIVRRYLYTLSRISVLCVHDTTSPCTSHMNTRTAHTRYVHLAADILYTMDAATADRRLRSVEARHDTRVVSRSALSRVIGLAGSTRLSPHPHTSLYVYTAGARCDIGLHHPHTTQQSAGPTRLDRRPKPPQSPHVHMSVTSTHRHTSRLQAYCTSYCALGADFDLFDFLLHLHLACSTRLRMDI